MSAKPSSSFGFCHHWMNLFALLWRRLISPLQFPIFVMYFVSLMFGAALIGTWSALWQSYVSKKLLADVPNSIATYAIALVAAAFADVVLEDNSRRTDDDTRSDSSPTFRMFALTLVIASGSLGVLALFFAPTNTEWSTFWACLAALMSMFLWWIVNADNPNLREADSDPAAPIGGDSPTDDLPGTLDDLTA